MLDSWSLRHGAVRKAVAARVYERKNLRRASLFHATSEMEADSIRQYGLKQPIAIVPNGVEIPAEAAEYPRRLLELQFPPLHGRRWLLFMGRLHPKKGLDMLIGAWRTLQSQFPDWHLLVAGPDQVGLRSSLEAMVADAGALRESITYTGMLDGAAKHSALANADVFVLPTRSENFGIAVAEALAHGTPVVTTTAAPWSDLTAVDCGWWVEPNQFAIANALAEAMSRTSSQLADQGRRGRQMVTEKYSWDGAAARMIAAYRWILDGGEKPNWVLEA
jgi:glycosyltransferase involved in cell wall biosynthesis